MSDEILTLEEAAAWLKVSPRSLWDRIQAGEVPSFKIGRQHRLRKSALQDWADAQASEQTEERNAS